MKASLFLRLSLAAIVSLPLRAACPQFEPAGVSLGNVQTAPGGNVNITEASGLVVSRAHPGVLWVNNDGHTGYPSQRVHALEKDGTVLGIYHVTNGSGTNWEGMTLGSGPNPAKDYLYIVNVGNGPMTVYRIEEPNANVGQAFVTQSVTADVFLVQLPGGLSADCETIMNDPLTGDLYFVTKRPSNTTTGVYRFPKANQIPGDPNRYTLQIVKDDIVLPLINGQNSSRAVTDGTISPNGTEIAIRTNGSDQRAYIWQWDRAGGQTMAAALSGTRCTIPMHAQGQGETIAFEPDGSGYYSISEGSNQPIWYHARIGQVPQTLTFTDTKDAMVKEKFPDTNFGADVQLQTSGEATFRKQTFVQFTVSGIPAGATVSTAQLKLRAQTTGTGRPVVAHGVADTSWSGATVTWNNKPALGASLSTISSHTTGQDSVWNVAAHVTGNGTFALGLDSTFVGDTTFDSREAANAPKLVVTYNTASVPAAPTGLAADGGNTQVALTWSASAGATSYNIKFATFSGGPYSPAGTSGITSFTHTGRTNGTTYYYVVSAVNGAGESANSAQASATPLAPVTVTFPAVKDSMVKEAAATTNFGTQNQLQCSGQAGFAKHIYLQFNVTGLPAGAVVLGSNLLIASQTTGTGRSVAAHAVSNTTWTETGITWSNKPALGASLATVSSHTANVDSSWNLGTHVTGNGNVAIGLDSTFAGDTNFHSREATDPNSRPELVITYQP